MLYTYGTELYSHDKSLTLGEMRTGFTETIDHKELKRILEENDFIPQHSNQNELFTAAVKLAYFDAKRTFSGISREKNGLDTAISNIANCFCRYFQNIAPTSEDEFYSIHSKLCKRVTEEFQSFYSLISYGQAQKIVNMTFKYLYCAKNRAPKYECFFQYCHMTLDSYTLAWFKHDVVKKWWNKKAENNKINLTELDGIKWSRINEDGEEGKPEHFSYSWFQKLIRDYLKENPAYYRDSNGNPLQPFFAEFWIWPEEQLKESVKEIGRLNQALKKNMMYASTEIKKEMCGGIEKLKKELK